MCVFATIGTARKCAYIVAFTWVASHPVEPLGNDLSWIDRIEPDVLVRNLTSPASLLLDSLFVIHAMHGLNEDTPND
jgi:hypothetical protein